MNFKESDFLFEEISEELLDKSYTDGCSNSVSGCCTRVCTRMEADTSIEEWGTFLDVGTGVIQY